MRVLLFVGSGISRAMEGVGSWKELLTRVTEQNDSIPSSRRSEIYALLSKPNAEYEAADELACCITADELKRQLCEIVRASQQQLMVKNPPLTKWGEVFGRISPEGIITTNWDTLLETVVPGAEKCTWPDDIEKVRECFRTHRKFVLHLHGDIDNGNIVATSSDCESVANTLSGHRPLLANLMSFHVQIVIGYSFPDRHIVRVFNRATSGASEDPRIVYVLDRAESGNILPKGAQVLQYADHGEFLKALSSVASNFDPTPALYRLAEPQSIEGLHEIIAPQIYTWHTLDTAYRYLARNPDRLNMTGKAAELLIEDPCSPSSGILATLLSKMPESWDPDSKTKRRMTQVVNEAIREGNTELVGMVEPLSVALSLKGEIAAHRKYLQAAIESHLWRNADYQRVYRYYDSRVNVQVDAIERHKNDNRREGALLANDVTRILTLLESGDANLGHLIPWVEDAIGALERSRNRKYAMKIQSSLDAILRARI